MLSMMGGDFLQNTRRKAQKRFPININMIVNTPTCSVIKVLAVR